ncbi:MAG TPA: glycosyltransferase family 2 protein, partial [Ktedonobacterales bacterium]|nr:glycosyltransferase family 2 protein [Ktedonobacterales bacterium]
RGLRAYAGFSQTGIPYERAERYSGFTTNSFLGLFRWASLGIISFSFAPLDLISYLAGGVVALTALASSAASHRAAAPATRPIINAMTSPATDSAAYPDTLRDAALPDDTLQADTVRMRALPHLETTSAAGPRLRLRPRELGRPPYVSVVVPCYNEQGNIRPMYERLTAALTSITPTYEIIFVNNGSYDHSPEILDEIASRDPRVSVISLSRNFGSQGAYSAGFAYCSGDCVVGLDGDIQDPPELIPAFVATWLEGYDVVYGVRARRKGSLPRRIGYKLFYRLLRKLSYVDIPVDASDFGLMDRRVVNVLNEMPERSRLIRGLRAYAGFSQTGIPYERAERYSGFTTNSFLGLFRWASLGIISFSFAPLDLISYLAGGVVALTALAMVIYTVLYFVLPGAPRGYETLLLVVLFLGAVQLLCLSIIGAYLGKIFEEVKARPRFLVNDVLNDHRASGVAGASGVSQASGASRSSGA